MSARQRRDDAQVVYVLLVCAMEALTFASVYACVAALLPAALGALHMLAGLSFGAQLAYWARRSPVKRAPAQHIGTPVRGRAHERAHAASAGSVEAAATAAPRTPHRDEDGAGVVARVDARAAAPNSALAPNGMHALAAFVDPSRPVEVAPQAVPKGFHPVEHVFQYPFEVVSDAVRAKYRPPCDPLHPHIQSADVVYERAYTDHGVTHLRREVITNLAFVPALLRRWLSAEAVVVVEDLEWRHKDRRLLTRVRNKNMRDIGYFEERGEYRQCDSNPEWTTFRSQLHVAASNWIGRQALSLTGTDARALISTHLAAVEERCREHAVT